MAISKRDNMLGAIYDTCTHFGLSNGNNVQTVGDLVGLSREVALTVFNFISPAAQPFANVATSYRRDVEYAVATGLLNGLKRPTSDFNDKGKYIDAEQSLLAEPFEENCLGFMRGELGMMNSTSDHVLHRAIRDASYSYPNIKRAGDAMRVIIATGRIAARHEEIGKKARKLELI